MEQENKNILNKVASKLEIAEDGKFSMNDIISMILKSPDCRIDRAAFLQEILEGKYDQAVIDKAIETNPAEAGINPDDLKAISKELIDLAKEEIKASTSIKNAVSSEKNVDKVKGVLSSISENRNLKSIVKTSQRVSYLFGFPTIKMTDKGSISQAKARLVMLLAMANMMGTEGASEALKAVAAVIPQLPEDLNIIDKLNDEEIGEILKKWRKKFIATYAAMKAVNSNPLVGTITKKGAADLSFEKNCEKLINTLSDTSLSNPNHVASEQEQKFIEMIKKAAEL